MKQNNPFGIQDDGKTAGLLSYFFILGWSMAFFTFHKNEKTRLSSFQLRQTLLLYITYLVVRYALHLFLHAFGLAGSTFSLCLVTLTNVTFITLWVIGLIGASKAEEKPIPVLGAWAQTMFAHI